MPDRAALPDKQVMADRVSVAGIAAGAVSVVAAIALSIAIAFVAVNLGHDARHPLVAGQRVPPRIGGDVTLQAAPNVDIARFRDEKRRLLDGYAWVDRDKGFARIPVERAMAMLADRAAKGSPQ